MRFRRRAPVRPTGTYTQWDWPPAPEGYRAFIWDLGPQTDPSPDGYFWSHQFWLVGGEAGYAGLQTSGSEPTGKIAIFSVWEALGGEGPDYAAPFSGEGSGFSVRIPFEWRGGAPPPPPPPAAPGAAPAAPGRGGAGARPTTPRHP